MPKKKKVTHTVVLDIVKDCADKPMTDKQIKKWVQEHFAGCDYGQVKIVCVDTNVDGSIVRS